MIDTDVVLYNSKDEMTRSGLSVTAAGTLKSAPCSTNRTASVIDRDSWHLIIIKINKYYFKSTLTMLWPVDQEKRAESLCQH